MIIELLFYVDDFYYKFPPVWEAELIAYGVKNEDANLRCRQATKCMTIVVAFHQSNHRDFKSFYVGLVQKYWWINFSNLLRYIPLLYKMSSLFIRVRKVIPPSI